MRTTIALVDDHVLLRNGLANLLRDLDYQILFEAGNGHEFIAKLSTGELPDIVLMDINMPVMDGYQTANWLKKNHPDVKILALSMYDDEQAIILMLKNGARGYILKDSEPAELKAALHALLQKGYYHSDIVTGKLIHSINRSGLDNQISDASRLTERELEFLKLACTELTYKQIADRMKLSPRTIDGYRDDLFEKLSIQSRVGLVIFAIKRGIVQL